MDPKDFDGVMQGVRFQCYRENIYGALELVESAHASHPDPRYAGEGAVAMAVAARHPATRVEGVEVAAANVALARKLNRFPNVAFREGLAEEVHTLFPAASFDLAYSFAVLEHVRDVEGTIRSISTVVRPGGRFCFVVPMHEFRATGPLPEYTPVHGYADHCRVFSE